MPSSPITISSERSTHSPTTVSGPTPEPAQVMRQPVGVRIQRRVAQLALLDTPPQPHPASPPPAPRTAPAGSRPATARAVAFQSSSDARAAPPPPGSPARRSHASGAAHRRLQQPDQTLRQRRQRSSGQTGRWRIPACPRSPPARRPRRAPRRRLSARSNFDVVVATASKRRRNARQAQARPPRCSGTPASPGTAGDATATAPG